MPFHTPGGPPPLPSDPWEVRRWHHTALRRRILSGTWGEDLEQWLRAHLGAIRRRATGPRDLSSNVLRTVAQQLSTLYDGGRLVRHPAGDLHELLASGRRDLQERGLEPVGTPAGVIAKAGLWSLMVRVQRLVTGCNEYVMHISHSARGGLLYRPVPPDRVEAFAQPNDPDTPVSVREARQWLDPATGKKVWVWEEYSIADPDRPHWRVYTPEQGHHKSRILEAREGPRYVWRDKDGAPFIPYVIYHRERTGELWDPWEGREVVDGTLTVAMLWTYFVHGVRDAAWVQRYIVNARLAGTNIDADDNAPPVNNIAADPTSILVFESDDDMPGNATVQIGQWSAPFAPDQIGLAIARFEERLAQYVGVSPADLVRTSGDPRSGYALAISAAGMERAQRRCAPQFARGDEELLAKTAMILNRATGSSWPEDGYQPVIPPAPSPLIDPTNPDPE